MVKIINLLIISLLLSFAPISVASPNDETCENSTAEEQVIDDMMEETQKEPLSFQEQWFLDFHIQALESQDKVLQAHAINFIYMTDEQVIKIENALNEILSKDISAAEYSMLLGVCESESFKEICQANKYQQKVIQKDTKNLIAYLPLLEKELENKTVSKKLKQQLQDTEFASIYYGYGVIALKQALMDYQAIKPMPIKSFEERTSYISYTDAIEDFSIMNLLKANEFFSKYENEVSINFIIFLQGMARIPAYSSVTRLCKRKDNEKLCQHISQLLITSKAMISNQIGYAITKIMAKNAQDYQSYFNASLKSIQLSDAISCYQGESEKFNQYIVLHPLHMNAFIANIESFDEISTYKLASHALKNYFISQGIETNDDINGCDEILDTSPEVYFEQHKDSEKIQQVIDKFTL